AATESAGWYYQAKSRCLQRLIERYVAADGKPLEILDVGCGTGGTSNALRRFGNVTGVERSPLAIELLKARYPDLHVIEGTVGQSPLPLEPASFDLATIGAVFYHRNTTDPAAAVRHVGSVLKPDGWIVWSQSTRF